MGQLTPTQNSLSTWTKELPEFICDIPRTLTKVSENAHATAEKHPWNYCQYKIFTIIFFILRHKVLFFFSACSKKFRFGHVQKAKGQAHRYWGFNVYGQAYNLGLVHCIPYTKFLIGHVNNISTMQFFPGISRNSQSKSQMLSLTECVWDIQNNALWDTHCLLSE